MNGFSRKDGFFVILLFLLLAGAFYDVVFLGKTFKVTTANSQALPTGAYGQENNKPPFIPVNGTDTPVMEEPLLQFIKLNLRRGILPFWNPHQACGYPLIGMIEVGMFFPLTFIMYLLPEWYAWDVLMLLRFLCGGLLTFWFMRSQRFRKIPSLAAAITFMLSGPMVLFQYWTANIDILLPLLLIAIERILRQGRPRDIAFFAGAVALTVLGGHPEHIFLVNFCAACFFFYRFIVLKTFRKPGRSIGAVLLGYLLGAGLTAFVTLPFFSNLMFQFWHGHPEGVGLLLEEHRERAITLILPHFFQKAPITYQWVFAGWWGGYLGLIPFALAFLSLFSLQRKGMNVFFLFALFAIISKEYALPYINWIGALPVFRVCRFASHTPMLAAFALAVLSGMGVRVVNARRPLFLKGLLFGAVILVIVNLHLYFFRQASHFAFSLKAALFALILIITFLSLLFLRDRKLLSPWLTGLCLTILLFSELALYIHRERPNRFWSFGQVPYMEFLKQDRPRPRSYGNFWAFYPNTATGFEVDDLGYFLGLVPKRYVQLVNTLLIPDHFRNDLRPPALRAIPLPGSEDLLDLLNVKYIVRPATTEFEQHFSHFPNIEKTANLVFNQEVRIYERPNAYPRVFVVHRAIFEPDPQKGLQIVNRLKKNLRHIAVINSRPIPAIANLLNQSPVVDESLAYIKEYSANEVMVEAVMRNPGFLLLSDAYHPDWKAFAGGQEIPLYEADSFIRAVFLPPGRHQVRFVFVPATFYAGLAMAAVSVAAMILLLLLPALSRRHKKKEAGHIS